MIRCYRTPVFSDETAAQHGEFSPAVFESMSTFLKDAREFLRQHTFDVHCPELVFLGLSSGQRRVLHKIAEECGLIHFSRNLNSRDRAFFVTDRSCLSRSMNLLSDAIFIRDYVCLEGAMIEDCATGYVKRIPLPWLEARKKRDCMDMHHITLLSKIEVRQLLSSEELSSFDDEEERKLAFSSQFIAMCHEVAKEIPVSSWQAQGIGKIEHEGNAAVYVIVSWPFGDQVRLRLELDPLDFHITLGFHPNDVNSGPRKDLSTRISDDIVLVSEEMMTSEINLQPMD